MPLYSFFNSSENLYETMQSVIFFCSSGLRSCDITKPVVGNTWLFQMMRKSCALTWPRSVMRSKMSEATAAAS